MTHGRTLDEAQLAEMAEMREAGRTVGQIQRHFALQGVSLSRGAIDWQCLRLGADLPPERRKAPVQPDQPFRRGRHFVRPFTASEDRLLLMLEAEGRSFASIGRLLGRRRNSIAGRLYILARRDARAEEQEARQGGPAVGVCGHCQRAAIDPSIASCSDPRCPLALEQLAA